MHVVRFDFQSDVTSCGRHIHFFNVIDEYTRTSLSIITRRTFTTLDVVPVLENNIAEIGTTPTYVCCVNGPEFTTAALIDCCNTVRGHLHRPGFTVEERFRGIVQRLIQKGTSLGTNYGHDCRGDLFGRGMENYLQLRPPYGSLDDMTPNQYWENWTQESQLAIAEALDCEPGTNHAHSRCKRTSLFRSRLEFCRERTRQQVVARSGLQRACKLLQNPCIERLE